MNIGKDLIVVAGATGQQGGAVAHELLAAGHKVRALSRNPQSDASKALAKKGAEVVAVDFDDEASIVKALTGAWGAFAVQNTWTAGVEGEEQQGLRFAEAAKRAGIQHLVYTSVASADRNTGIPHFENKRRVEKRIQSLGFPSYTIVRPVFFMENLTSPWFLPYIQQGNLAVGMKADTPLQMIAVADIGKYGRLAFEKHAELNGQGLDIAGDELTMPEAAAVLTKVAGFPVGFYSVPIEDVRKASADFASMLEWFDAIGYDVHIRSLSRWSGIRPTTFSEWAAKAQWAPAPAVS